MLDWMFEFLCNSPWILLLTPSIKVCTEMIGMRISWLIRLATLINLFSKGTGFELLLLFSCWELLVTEGMASITEECLDLWTE